MRFISKLAFGIACMAVAASTCHATSLETLGSGVVHLKSIDESAEKDNFRQACPLQAATMAEVAYKARNVELSMAENATIAAVDLKGSILLTYPWDPSTNESVKRKVQELEGQDIWLVVSDSPDAVAAFFLVPEKQGAPCSLLAMPFGVTLSDG